MAHGSRKAVFTAIVTNSIVTVIKFTASVLSGSAAMTNEAVHSLMDTLNQAFLLIGLKEADRPADAHYAFGHGQKKYLWNLWSAIGLFSIGCGLGLSHAWHSWRDLGHSPAEEATQLFHIEVSPLTVNLVVLGIAFLLEGYSFVIAIRAFLGAMRDDNFKSPFNYLFRAKDPTLVAVVLEDGVAMLGLLFAAFGVGLTALTGNEIWDVLFSALIAVMLGVIAFYLGRTNMRYLADMRDANAEQVFADVAEAHAEVERYHDLRSIILDESYTILVGEVELKEEAIIPGLDSALKEAREKILAEVEPRWRDTAQARSYAESYAAVTVTLSRAESIIDELEAEIRRRSPQVTHITLEVEGISAAAPARMERSWSTALPPDVVG